MSLSPGKARGLDTLATAEGVFAILAIDHRDSLRVVLPGEATDSEIVDFKLDLIRGVGGAASGVMLEPEFTLPQAIEAGALPGSVGFMAALEAQGYMGDPWAGPTTMMPGWSALDAKRMGAGAAKLLLPFSPVRVEHAAEQERVLGEVVGLCTDLDIALLVEPVAFGMLGPERPSIVAETVRRLTNSGLDVLKLEFPGDPDDPSGWDDACAAVTDAASVPWVLLSSGVTYDAYKAQLEVAFRHGCSGFTGGRAIWSEAATADQLSRAELITGVVTDRITELRDLAAATATPWRSLPAR
ncbi:MAG: hypothetical protein ACR2P0_09465 [Acidimicrobiales bacterium]